MSVFIVMLGEDHEGGSVVAAAASLEGARRWQQGCDWMTIRKHIVLD